MAFWKLLRVLSQSVVFTIFSTPMFMCEAALMALVVFLNCSVVYLTGEWFEYMDDLSTEEFQRQQAKITELIRCMNEQAAEAAKPKKSKSKFSLRNANRMKRHQLMKKVRFLLRTTPSDFVVLEKQRHRETVKLMAFLYSVGSLLERNDEWELTAPSELSMGNSVVSVYKNIEMRSSRHIPAKCSSSSFREEQFTSESGMSSRIVHISSNESVTITRGNKSSTSYI